MPRSNSTLALGQGPRVAVVEDDPLVCLGLTDMLNSHGWAVEDFSDGEAFLASGPPKRFDCLLLDAKLPGIDGVGLLKALREGGFQLPVIIVTGASDIRLAVAAMKAGAADFIEKPVQKRQLIEAVERCLAPRPDLASIATDQSAAAERINNLTPRQLEVMTLILDGQLNKNIAADLGISQRTVENHRASIMKRTSSASLPELARLALMANLPDPASPVQATQASPPPVVASALPHGDFDDDQFRRFFDAVPVPIIIGAMSKPEVIVYANPAFEMISGRTLADIEGAPWPGLGGVNQQAGGRPLGESVIESTDWVGLFELESGSTERALVDAYVSVIVDDESAPAFRLVALVVAEDDKSLARNELEDIIRDKDAMILEIQHRVKNNLQMITSLIRIEARKYYTKAQLAPLDRLEGRINSIQIIYRLLSEFSQSDQIDLGVYLSEIASAVMHSHAVEGIRLDLKVDAYPVSVNVALPTGLVANELLTNALKHAFVGRDGGTITLHSLSDARGCWVTVADDGVGLPPGVDWPKQGKLGELIVRSLRQNAKADLQVESAPGKGTKVTIFFSRSATAPVSPA